VQVQGGEPGSSERKWVCFINNLVIINAWAEMRSKGKTPPKDSCLSFFLSFIRESEESAGKSERNEERERKEWRRMNESFG